jgi:probable DNA metabolism protein
MHVALDHPHDLACFRAAARGLIAAGLAPREVVWHESGQGLFAAPALPAGPALAVPARFVRLADDVICHRDAARLPLLYELLWRLTQGERGLLADAADRTVHRLALLQKAVGRDLHKMHAFLRFRHVEAEDRYVAWFEPEHMILERAAPFFTGRFPSMRWSILTPIGTLHWDGAVLTRGAPVGRDAAPKGDDLEDWWRTYYRATFNPARANPEMMRAEMPKRYWKNLPEAALIPELLEQAAGRTAVMLEAGPTTPRKAIPGPAPATHAEPPDDVAALARDAACCRRCPLFGPATQTVFGEGPPDARIMMVGEQPGDQEDLQGRPFVGPAGQLLDRALDEAGVDRSTVYVTNAVKHFKFEPRGKRRIHKKPDRPEIEACKFWLERELKVIRPQLVVALGGTAAQALTGRAVKVLSERGRPVDDPRGFRLLITIHPSMILRVPDLAAKEQAFADFVRDLRQAA